MTGNCFSIAFPSRSLASIFCLSQCAGKLLSEVAQSRWPRESSGIVLRRIISMCRPVFGSRQIRFRTLQKCNETIHHRLCLDDCRDYERINLEYSMDRLRPELSSRSWRPESIPRHKGQTECAALPVMRFDRLQPSPTFMRRLRPCAARGLSIHGHGGKERGNASED